MKKQELTVINLEGLVVKVETGDSEDPAKKLRCPCQLVKHIFTCPTDLIRKNLAEYEIKLTDDPPFKEPYRPILLAFYEEIRQHLVEMIEDGAKSEYDHNHELQTDPRHPKEELQNINSNKTSKTIKAKQQALSSSSR